MKIVSKIGLFILIILITSCYSSHIRKGDAAAYNLQFVKAAKHYERALKIRNNYEINSKLAIIYDRMNKKSIAETYYLKAIESDSLTPEFKLMAAKNFLSNNQHEEGIRLITEYLNDRPEDSVAREWLLDRSRIGYIDELDSSQFSVEELQLGGFANTFGAIRHDNTVYFIGTTEKKPGEKVNPWTGQSFTDIFQVDRAESEDITTSSSQTNLNEVDLKFGQKILHSGFVYSSPKIAIKSLLHDGSLTMNNEGNVAYVTRSAVNKSGKVLFDNTSTNQLIISKYLCDVDGKWKLVSDLPFNQTYSSALHPVLTTDEQTMFFASDRPGGEGANDLFMSTFNGVDWGEPVNLGPRINTYGNEVFPFAYHKDTLFFSSDAHGGMGGFDIYRTVFDGNKWSLPENFKAPINSPHDDFAYFKNVSLQNGYFSSNRDGKDKIYFWEFNDPVFTMIGKVVDKDHEPVKGTTVVLKEGENPVDSVKTSREGNFTMNLEWKKDYEVSGYQKDFRTDTIFTSTKNIYKSDSIFVELELNLPKFLVHGIVVDKNSRKRLSNVKVELHSDLGSLLDGLNTDDKGEFVFKLDRDETYFVDANKKNYFSSKVNFNTLKLVESKVIEVVLEIEEVIPDIPVVLNNIYYDFDKWEIRADAREDLDNLFTFMKNNSELKIELGSHTDCRGSDDYNNELSEKRANSAVNYLIKKGLDKKRFVYKGYGESKLINHCKDDVKCSEVEHQKNRRTEFKVLK